MIFKSIKMKINFQFRGPRWPIHRALIVLSSDGADCIAINIIVVVGIVGLVHFAVINRRYVHFLGNLYV
jgi:hypothetical protein